MATTTKRADRVQVGEYIHFHPRQPGRGAGGAYSGALPGSRTVRNYPNRNLDAFRARVTAIETPFAKTKRFICDATEAMTFEAGEANERPLVIGPINNSHKVLVSDRPHGDVAGPTVTGAAPAAGATTAVFTSSEVLDEGTVAVGDFAETSAAAITGVAVGGDGRTITVTFDAPLIAGETVTLNANSIADESGNTGPAAPVTVTVV